MLAQWEIVVMLAREVDKDCALGRLDATRTARLARAVIEFQARITRSDSQIRPAPPRDGEDAA